MWFVRLINWQRCSLSHSRRTGSGINNRSTHVLENIHISVNYVELVLCYEKKGVKYEGIVVIITRYIIRRWVMVFITHKQMDETVRVD